MKAGCKVKICGITRLEDRQIAAEAMADFFGVVIEVPYSPRSLTVEAAAALLKHPPIPGVALVYNPDLSLLHRIVQECRPYAVQLLSAFPPAWPAALKKYYPEMCWWQSLHLPAVQDGIRTPQVTDWCQELSALAGAGIDTAVFDTAATLNGETRYGGTGLVSDWSLVHKLAESAPVPVFLAGGISPDNVRAALAAVQPDGIDLCSGVETEPGRKDPAKVKKLIRLVREWEENSNVKGKGRNFI